MKALEIEEVSCRFGGVVVLDHVSLQIEEGARHVVFGPNGAGKTTLFRAIVGEVPLAGGRVRLFGDDVTGEPVWRRTKMGLGRTFQATNLFPALSLADNLRLACQAPERGRWRFWGPRRRTDPVERQVTEILEAEGLRDRSEEPVDRLSYGEQRLLEIAVAMAAKPRVLLLDEPGAGLPRAQARQVVRRLAELPDSIAVLLIEHDLKLAFELSRTATVLHHGELVTHGELEAVRADPRVRELYLGRQDVPV